MTRPSDQTLTVDKSSTTLCDNGLRKLKRLRAPTKHRLLNLISVLPWNSTVIQDFLLSPTIKFKAQC